MSHSDDFGDRMKQYEAPSTATRFFKGLPLIVRLDGRAFHTFTKGLGRPYDKRLSDLMVDTTIAMVDRFHATVGYCQSDEITLAWHLDVNSDNEYPFKGRRQKIESLMAAYCSVVFNKKLATAIPEKADAEPTFDARAFQTPTLLEAYNEFLWRQQDCVKNAISMAAQSMFTHKSLSGLSGAQMQERMWAEKGINFNDYPPFFKRGTFVRKIRTVRPLTSEELAKIPAKMLPVHPQEVVRSSVVPFDIWLGRTTNSGVNILFGGEEPIYESAFK